MADLPYKSTRRERRFAAEYPIDFNGSAAITRAGFKGKRPDAAASKLLAKPGVKALVEAETAKALERAGVRTDAVLRELASIAFSDFRKLFDADGNLKPVGEWDDQTAASVSAIDIERLYEGKGTAREATGTLHKVKRFDKVRALELIGKHLKLFAERVEHTGANGGPIILQSTPEDEAL